MQSLKGSMRVYCRVKPLEIKVNENCVDVLKPLLEAEVPMSMTLNFEKDSLVYNFDGVFDTDASQADIFT